MLTLLIAQFACYACVWLICAILLREARVPALAWAAYSVLQGIGLVLLSNLASEQVAINAPAAAVMLLAYLSADAGLDAFVNARVRYARVWGTMIVLIAGFLLAYEASKSPLVALAVGYNLFVVGLLVLPLALLWRAFVREFAGWGWLAILPGALMAAFVLARTAVVLKDPALLNQPMTARSPAVLATTLVGAAVFHLGLLGLIVARFGMRLRRNAVTDALTGLANRAGLYQHLTLSWHSARRQGHPLSIAFIDIDRFKQINDTAGHALGDRVIEQVAESLRRQSRQSDAAGRWGGDEFLVVMPHTDARGAEVAAERLRASVSNVAVTLPAGLAPLSLSVGTATLEPGDPNVDALIARADAAMYEVKQRLRAGTTRVAEPHRP